MISVNTATLEAEILKPLKLNPFFETEKIQIQKQDALALEVDHFVQAVSGLKPLAITALEATEALRTIEKIVARAESLD